MTDPYMSMASRREPGQAPNYLNDGANEAENPVSPRMAVLPTDPKWLQDMDKALLTELDLEQEYGKRKGNSYEDGGLPLPLLEKLTTLLVTNTTLQKLSLKRCNISDVGLDIVGLALKSNHTITDLDLSHNNLSASALDRFRCIMEPNYSIFIAKVLCLCLALRATRPLPILPSFLPSASPFLPPTFIISLCPSVF